MNISEKVAYLKGLAEGLDIGTDSKNGKIINGILDVLEEIASHIRSMEEEAKGEKFRENRKETQTANGPEKDGADSEYLDGVFELSCPHCKKQIFIQTDEILESDTMSIECPECGREIDIIDEAGGESENSCAKCPGCAGHFKDGEDGESPGL